MVINENKSGMPEESCEITESSLEGIDINSGTYGRGVDESPQGPDHWGEKLTGRSYF